MITHGAWANEAIVPPVHTPNGTEKILHFGFPSVFLKYSAIAKLIAVIDDTASGQPSTYIPADCRYMIIGFSSLAACSMSWMIFAAAAPSMAPHSTEKSSIITPNF